jgi:hypothetical protein
MLAIIPHVEDLNQFSKSDTKLNKLTTLKMKMAFDTLKQNPTSSTLKQYEMHGFSFSMASLYTFL